MIQQNNNKEKISMSTSRTLYHGTAFCTLYIMSQIKDPLRFMLLSHGTLSKNEIPCFVGECGKGITKNGVNQIGTSWTSDFDVAREYATGDITYRAGGARYSLNASRYHIESMIEEYNKVFIEKIPKHFWFIKEDYDWEVRILDVRRLRTFNDQEFKDKYLPGLIIWCNKVQECLDTEYLNNDMEWFRIMGADVQKHLIRFKDMLTKPLCIAAKNDKERDLLLDQTPIVLEGVTNNYKDFEDGEFLVKSPMQLGKDITCIYTEEKSIPKVESFLQSHSLFKNVRVKRLEPKQVPEIEKYKSMF